MLLSEILKLAELTNKPVNESYKSSELQKLLDMFSRSSIMLKSVYDRSERLKYLFDGLDDDMIMKFYMELIQSGKATQEDFDDPNVRESHFDIKYEKTFSNPIERRKLSPVRILTKQLQDHGCNVDISQLTDLDIEYVSTNDAKTKYKYRNGLLFWCDWNHQLRAVTYNNKIIMFIKYRVSWYMNNKDYIGPTDLTAIYNDNFIINEKALKEFIKKAYIEIPRISIITDPEDLKKEGLTSLPKLDKGYFIIYAYYVKLSALKKNDITKKLESRRDYAEFLREQYNITKEQIHQGKEFLEEVVKKNLNIHHKKQAKNKKVTTDRLDAISNVRTIIDLTYDNIFQITEELHKAEIDYLSNTTDSKYVNYNFAYDSITLPQNIIPFFKKAMPDKELGPHYTDQTEDTYDSFKIHNVGDLFVIVNVYVQYIVYRCGNLLESYNQTVNALNTVKDYAKTAQMLNDLKWQFDSYKDLCAGILGNNKTYERIGNIILSETGIDCKLIFKVFEPYKIKI